MTTVTLHVPHAELAPLIRDLLALAGGDRTAVAATSGGAVVDERLAYTYLAGRVNGGSPPPVDPPGQPATHLLHGFVTGQEQAANLGPAAPDPTLTPPTVPTSDPAPRKRAPRKATAVPTEELS